MSYTRNPTWENLPSIKTPIAAARLNRIEDGIVEQSERLDAHDAAGVVNTSTAQTIGGPKEFVVPPVVPAPSAGHHPVRSDDARLGTATLDRLTALERGKASPVALVDAATIATDASLGRLFTVTIAADRTLGAPTNPTDGQVATWEVTASGGQRTLTLATGTSGFVLSADVPNITPTGSGLTDYIQAIYRSSIDRWRVIGYTKGGGATETSDRVNVALDVLSVGEGTGPRWSLDTKSLNNQNLSLSYFTAQKTETINNLRTWTGGTAAAATPTLCRLGIYSEDSSGNLTLVASTPNDTALWAAANTGYTKTLSTAWSKTAGQRYALGVLIDTAVATPSLVTQYAGGVAPAEALSRKPRLAARRHTQTDLPASITDVELNSHAGGSMRMVYAEMTP